MDVQATIVMEGMYLVAAVGDKRESYIFMAKVSSNKNKQTSKLKKVDCVIGLKE